MVFPNGRIEDAKITTIPFEMSFAAHRAVSGYSNIHVYFIANCLVLVLKCWISLFIL